MFGVDAFAATNAPAQAGILAVGAIAVRVLAVERADRCAPAVPA
jgi:hypothetical protein